MLCQSCQHSNPDGNRFCGKCGASLSAVSDAPPSHAQNTVDYLQRVAREHPRGERPENPATPEGSYETQPATDGADLEQERERARTIYQFRDSHSAPLDFRSKGYPREGYDDAEQPVVELQPELIEFENRIPLIATPGMDRRRPEWRFQEKPLLQPDAEGELREKTQQHREDEDAPLALASELPATPHTSSTMYSESIFGLSLDTPTEETLDIGDMNAPGASVANEKLHTETPVRREANYGNSFLNFSEATQDDRTSLHGPSFLGLSSEPMDSEYLEDNDGGSHARRNLALAIVLVLVALGALQWRSIRDFGMRYAGTMHLPGRGGETAQATPAPNNPPAPQATQPASNGTPEMVAEAVQNPNAKSQNATPPAGTQGGAPPSANLTGANQHASPANNGANNPTQPPSQDTTVASNRDRSGLPQGEPATTEDASKDETDNETTPAEARRNNAQPKETSRPDAGQAELAQASAAPDPETASAWLWRAVGKGSPEAQVRLADMYADGRGVPQNCEQAVVLLNSAATKNFARARIRLGSMYATGKCVQQDRVAAYQWMSRALDSSPGSQWVEENRQMLWTQMSEAERRRAGGKM